ncbi:MAG: DUF459 domain-containing protein [Pseudolabrys sp.]|nr:DUF459 domain-containing protein [Pseudolabrys sp.]
MRGRLRFRHWLIGAAMLAALELAGALAAELAVTLPAQAQFWDDSWPFQRQRRSRVPGFFQRLFGPSTEPAPPPRQLERMRPGREHVESSRAPPPRKVENAAAPTNSIVVMGDGMADWLAYGLEEAFSDTPEVGVVREIKFNSGLIRYQAKSDLDWWHVARDLLAKDKASFVVMMIGLSDRQNIRERDLANEAAKDADKSGDNPSEVDAAGKDDNETEPGAAITPEPKGKRANGVIEFRTDRWAEVYGRRVDETIAALKSKGVPVFWVGLPSIRGTRSTSEASYLNEIYRAHAERAGIVYVDIWDGFVDESGRYSNFGPDLEGQTRRLRSSDGVFFTRYGARKLAHYVEREIRRYLNNRAMPVALPPGPVAPPGPESKSATRPLAGPVVPLTATAGNADQLAGAAAPQPAPGDALAAQVLVKGEALQAPTGRADDFAWPTGREEEKAAQPGGGITPVPAAAPAAATAAPAAVDASPASAAAPSARGTPSTISPSTKSVQKEKSKSSRPPRAAPRSRSPDDEVPRPPAPVGRASGPFGWAR